jgi:Domain of unknown function (DUF4304)
MSRLSPPRLESSIRSAFAPLLRAEGFAGSGRRFHKYFGPWIQIITVQGSRYGGSFAVNLGIHFSAAPDVAGNPPDPKKMIEAHCEFRRPLSETSADMWWEHELDQTSMLYAVESAASMYSHFGCRYFEFACAGLNAITPEALASGTYDLQGFGSTKVRLGLALARIRKLEGRADDSRGFAAYALTHIGSATALKTELQALAAT